MPTIEVKFSEQLHDQMVMVAAGGYWSFNTKGEPIMRFPSVQCYQEYLEEMKKSTVVGRS